MKGLFRQAGLLAAEMPLTSLRLQGHPAAGTRIGQEPENCVIGGFFPDP
jgi:hypothetical protein